MLRSLVIVYLFTVWTSAQTVSTTSERAGMRVTPLETSASPRATRLRASAILGPLKCDREGTLYLRQYFGDDTDAQNPVVALRNDGTVQAEFRLKAVPGLAPDSSIFTYAVYGGRLFALLGDQSEGEVRLWLAEFDRQGVAVTKSLFARSFFPSVLAPLSPDRFYVAGLNKPLGPSSTGKERPIAGVFDSEARLVKDLTMKSEAGKIEGIIGAHLGDASLGPDGMLYVLKASAEPVVTVLTPAGEVARRFQLRPPLPGAQAYELHALEGRFIVSYQWSKLQKFAEGVEARSVYTVYNLYDGEPIVNYTNQVRGIPACFNEDAITFLTTTPSGFFGLLSVPLR